MNDEFSQKIFFAPSRSSSIVSGRLSLSKRSPIILLPGGNLLLDMSIGKRLTLGFLVAAFIATTIAGSIGVQRIESFNQQSEFYRHLLQVNTSLIMAKQPGVRQEVCISVKDQGPGIPLDEQPFLFEKFMRLQRDLSGPIRGTGLGLYICKQLVETMHGHIWIESTGIAGQGSRFCFTLPGSSLSSTRSDESLLALHSLATFPK